MPKRVAVDRTYPLDALERLYRQEHDGRLKERLLAILFLYEGKTITATADLLQVNRHTVGAWLAAWNQGAYQGLKPDFKGGYAPRLSERQWQQILAQLPGQGYDIQAVKQLIYQQTGVAYSYKMVWYKLRKHYQLPYGKPYMQNRKMPADVELQIEKK
jgi:transposase